MASELYARYIPPKKRKYENFPQLEEQPQSKRRKVKPETEMEADKEDKKVDEEETVEDNTEEMGVNEFKDKIEGSTKDKTKDKTEKKKAKKKIERAMDKNSENTNRHHDSILLKREKSTRNAEKYAKKVEREAEISEEPVQEEAPVFQESDVYPLQPLPQPEPVPEVVKKGTLSALPAWLTSPILVSPTAKSPFTTLGIRQDVASHLQSQGFEQALAIQTAVIPLLLHGKNLESDLLVSAPTGSGKTLSYVLPMLSDISQTSISRLRGIIIMPTRELVDQARKVCEFGVTAFSSRGRRRVKIGTASGSQLYETELANLMYAERVYEPCQSLIPNLSVTCGRRPSQQAKIQRELMAPRIEGSYGIFPGVRFMAMLEAMLETEWTPTPPIYIPPAHTIRYMPMVDILICTPGRLVHHLQHTRGFTLDHVNWLIIDEADKLIGQSYQNWLDVVMDRLTVTKLSGHALEVSSERRVTKVLLSATLSRNLADLSHLKLKSPKLVVLDEMYSTNGGASDLGIDSDALLTLPESLQEYVIKVKSSSDKPLQILALLKNHIADEKCNPILSQEASSNDLPSQPRGVLVFTNSNEAAVRLSELLKLLEPSFSGVIGTITSGIPASDRKKTLRDFNNRKLSIIIASDLVARGLDIPSLATVINYDAPTTATQYVHRVGRTARAGKPGRAYTLEVPGSIWVGKRIRRSAGRGVIPINGIGDVGKEASDIYQAALAELGDEVSGKKK